MPTGAIRRLPTQQHTRKHHENRHLERQFPQRPPAPSTKLAGRPPSRHPRLTRTQTRPRQIPGRRPANDGLALRLERPKTYNGVAIISRHEPQDVHCGLPALPDDPQRRVIAATINSVRVINVYCVNGEALDSPKFQYKEQWFAALTEFVRTEMAAHPKLVLLGDFNIAPADADCYDPEKWHEKIHCSSIERQWFKNLLDLGLTDSLRKIHPEGAFYTWFDYRGAMFQRKLGLRIDHILTSPELAAPLTDVTVDLETRAQERPSDHAPVIAEFDC